MLKFIKQHGAGLLIALVLAVSLLGGLQQARGDHFADPDGFYHAKVSQLLGEGQLGNQFPWSYYSTWKDGYADQHYLYHWLLVPFNTVERLPWSVIIFGGVFAVAFYLSLTAFNARWKLFWLLVMLLGSVDFLFRINLVKANTLSLALLCAVAALVYIWHTRPSRRTLIAVLIGLVSAAFTWTYGGFVCVPLFIAAYCLAAGLSAKKVVFIPVLASLVGIVVGIALHPHASHFPALMYDQLFQTGLGAGRQVPAGNEWAAFDLKWFIQSNILLVIIWLVGLLLAAKNYLRRNENSWQIIWLQISAVGFLILALWHRRFIEYWVPFAVIASAVTLSPYLARLTWQAFRKALKTEWQFSVVMLLLLGSIVFAVNFNLTHVIGSLRNGHSAYEFQNAAKFMATHNQTGDIVFNTQWDQLPQLFYWDDQNYYIIGLDPTFMYLHDKALYWQWREIVDDTGQKWGSAEQVHEIIKNQFRAKFVFLENDRNKNLKDLLAESGQNYFDLVYADSGTSVYQVR